MVNWLKENWPKTLKTLIIVILVAVYGYFHEWRLEQITRDLLLKILVFVFMSIVWFMLFQGLLYPKKEEEREKYIDEEERGLLTGKDFIKLAIFVLAYIWLFNLIFYDKFIF